MTFKTFWGSKSSGIEQPPGDLESLRVCIRDFDNKLFVRELLMDVNGTLFV